MDLGKDSFGVDVATVDMLFNNAFAAGLSTDDGGVFALRVEAEVLCFIVM